MSIPNILYGPPGEQFVQSSGQKRPLGTLMVLQDGRWFRYGKQGSVAQTQGKMHQSEVPLANFAGLAISTAGVVGDNSVTFTNGGTAIGANDFNEGYASFLDVDGEGSIMQLGAHTASDASVAKTLGFAPGHSLQKATTTSTTLDLVKHHMKDVILTVATPTAMPIGASSRDMTANYYGWYQTHGPASLLTAGTLVIGQLATCITTAGAVGPAGGDLQPAVGWTMKVGATTSYSIVFMKCD